MKVRRSLATGASCLLVLPAMLFGTPQTAAAFNVYVSNEGSNTVSVIDTVSNMVVATIDVGVGPRPLTVSPDGMWVYVANFGTNPTRISVISTASNTVVATITAGTGPTRIGFSLDSTVAYAINEGSNDITVIDTATQTVVGPPVATGAAPRGCGATPDGKYGIVCNQLSNDVWVFDGTTPSNPVLVAQIPVGMSPQGGVFTPDGAYLYLVGSGADIVVIDMTTFTVLTRITVGVGAFGDIRPDGALLYVTTSGSANVLLIDTNPANPTFNTVVGNVPVGAAPLIGGGFVPSGAFFLVFNQQSQLLKLDTDPASGSYHTVVGNLPLPGLTDDDRAGITPDSASLYVTNKLSTRVQAVDVAMLVVTNITVGTSPTHLAISPF